MAHHLGLMSSRCVCAVIAGGEWVDHCDALTRSLKSLARFVWTVIASTSEAVSLSTSSAASRCPSPLSSLSTAIVTHSMPTERETSQYPIDSTPTSTDGT